MKTKKQIEEKLKLLEFGSLFISNEKDGYACKKSIELLNWVLDN